MQIRVSEFEIILTGETESERFYLAQHVRPALEHANVVNTPERDKDGHGDVGVRVYTLKRKSA